jgi:2-iminobutanoate/2-iminopropanoate deaminase
VRVGNVFYLAGKIGVTDSTRALASGRTAAETRNVLEAFRTLLAEQGLSFADVVQATVYLADIADYGEMNQVYAQYFPTDPPARETVAVSGIVSDARVEISLIAVRTNRR